LDSVSLRYEASTWGEIKLPQPKRSDSPFLVCGLYCTRSISVSLLIPKEKSQQLASFSL
jgi:hypothetical protein